MVTDLSNIGLSKPLKRTYSDLEFKEPAGDDVTFGPDEMVLTAWTPEIEDDDLGVLSLYRSGVDERIIITGNLTGSSCIWSVSSELRDADDFFIDGDLYWISLEVYPEGIQAASVYLTFRELSDESASIPTNSDGHPTTTLSSPGGEGSTAIVSKTSIIYQTATSVIISQPTLWFDSDPSPSTWQTMDSGAKAGIVIAGIVLIICLMVLLGLFIYRKRKSSAAYCEPGGDDDTAVGGFPEHQAGSDSPSKEENVPRTDTAGQTGAQRHSASYGNLHEME